MKTINEIRAFTATQEYDRLFWDAMRLKTNAEDSMRNAMSGTTGAFFAGYRTSYVLSVYVPSITL